MKKLLALILLAFLLLPITAKVNADSLQCDDASSLQEDGTFTCIIDGGNANNFGATPGVEGRSITINSVKKGSEIIDLPAGSFDLVIRNSNVQFPRGTAFALGNSINGDTVFRNVSIENSNLNVEDATGAIAIVGQEVRIASHANGFNTLGAALLTIISHTNTTLIGREQLYAGIIFVTGTTGVTLDEGVLMGNLNPKPDPSVMIISNQMVTQNANLRSLKTITIQSNSLLMNGVINAEGNVNLFQVDNSLILKDITGSFVTIKGKSIAAGLVGLGINNPVTINATAGNIWINATENLTVTGTLQATGRDVFFKKDDLTDRYRSNGAVVLIAKNKATINGKIKTTTNKATIYSNTVSSALSSPTSMNGIADREGAQYSLLDDYLTFPISFNISDIPNQDAAKQLFVALRQDDKYCAWLLTAGDPNVDGYGVIGEVNQPRNRVTTVDDKSRSRSTSFVLTAQSNKCDFQAQGFNPTRSAPNSFAPNTNSRYYLIKSTPNDRSISPNFKLNYLRRSPFVVLANEVELNNAVLESSSGFLIKAIEVKGNVRSMTTGQTLRPQEKALVLACNNQVQAFNQGIYDSGLSEDEGACPAPVQLYVYGALNEGNEKITLGSVKVVQIINTRNGQPVTYSIGSGPMVWNATFNNAFSSDGTFNITLGAPARNALEATQNPALRLERGGTYLINLAIDSNHETFVECNDPQICVKTVTVKVQ